MSRGIGLAVVLLLVGACGSGPPVPASGGPLSQAQLKFAVMDAVGKPVWCDLDFYPLARAGVEQANAIAKYPEIRADGPTYAAILAHEHLPPGDLDDAQKLTLYRAWKLLRVVSLTPGGAAYSFDYETATATAYEQVAGTVATDGRVNVTSRTAAMRPSCPICLAASTLIAAPGGPLRVTDIRVGMVVWTRDAGGRRVAEPVIAIGSTPVPAGHLMVHLVLADGRELLVSPGHPTADGRHAGDLRAGETLDGSTITLWELVPYDAGRTYDLLPAGATGHYWANGILMGSTLSL